MQEAVVIGLKAIAGGVLVVAFSLLTSRLKEKTFAGVFGAAPSVALASLAITAIVMGSPKADQAAHAMIAGAGGMVAFCATAVVLEKRTGAIVGSGIAWLAWLLVAVAVYWLVLR